MNKSSAYTWLASLAGFIGIGMILGHSLGNSTQNTSLWVGRLLIFFGAITLGMAIATNSSEKTPSQNASKKENLAKQKSKRIGHHNQS